MLRLFRFRIAVHLAFASIATTTSAISDDIAQAGDRAAGPPIEVPTSSTTSSSRGAVSTIGVLASDNYRCTATVVSSDSESVIATAAHCVFLNGRWNLDNLRFYPGYHDGQAPFGVWQVDSAWVSNAWKRRDGQGDGHGGSPLHDFAFARLRPNTDGQTAVAALGSEGIRFDTQPGASVTELGYPAKGGYDGESLRSCDTVTKPITLSEGTAMTSECGFTQGASGGPWLAGGRAGGGSGQVTGVLSLTDEDGRNYAAPFNAEAQQLYTMADSGGR